MQTFTHQSHTAVGRGMCNSYRSVSESIKPVPFCPARFDREAKLVSRWCKLTQHSPRFDRGMNKQIRTTCASCQSYYTAKGDPP